MNKDQYIAMFEGMGFFCHSYDDDEGAQRREVAEAFRAGRVLRHDNRDLPTLYFGGTDESPNFTTLRSQHDRFSAHFWESSPGGGSDSYMNVVPRRGFERDAFDTL